ncbi:MAG: carbohydrate binding family 9 domain-containing protein [Gemmatimonadota bacterium]|nr:MAG: carbohydrate binding family 9 domain-containing protein [Gemmatimonadota bacterium]
MRGAASTSLPMLAAGLLSLAASEARAQGQVELPRLSGSVQLDGFSDEPAWAAIEPLPLTMHWPTFGGLITERSEIRVGYDDDYLYFAGRFYDADPAGIRANTLYRDRWNGDDAFDIVIDSFNDNETALKFTTTPLGVMLDQEISNDADPSGGAQPVNRDWNTFWDVATRITEEGWFAEVRVPFSSLGYEVRGERVVMGLIVGRYISRKDEKYTYPAIPPNWALADIKPSQAQDVVLTGVGERAPLYVTPYLLGGVDRTRSLSEPVGPPGTETTGRVGLDVKYGLTNNLTLDLTINTDFAQVEADDQQVNLTRFDLFFPEKRRFFQERSSVFQFITGDEGRLFHSRRVGLTEEGEALPILAGARVTGRVGAWDVGVMDMQVDAAAGRPGENDAALRVRRAVLNSSSAVGGMVTGRATTNGEVDVSYGADALLNLFGDDYLTLQWAQSYNYDDGPASALDRALTRVFWQRRSLNGLGYEIEAARSGSAYEPRLGFEGRDDYTALKSNFTYAWQPDGGVVSRHKGWVTSRLFLRNGDGSVESALQRLRWSIDFRGGSFFNVALNFEYENLDELLEFSEDAFVPAGSYFGPNVFLYYRHSPGAQLNGDAVLHVGTLMDGWRGRLSLRPAWVVSSQLTLSTEYTFHRLWFPGRGQRFDADISRLRLQAALNTRLFADAFLQYNMAAERFAANLRVRYRFSEGRDLYLVYDETQDLGRLSEDLVVAGKSDRRVLIKYEHTFQP